MAARKTKFEKDVSVAIDNLKRASGGIGWEIETFEELLSKYKEQRALVANLRQVIDKDAKEMDALIAKVEVVTVDHEPTMSEGKLKGNLLYCSDREYASMTTERRNALRAKGIILVDARLGYTRYT